MRRCETDVTHTDIEAAVPVVAWELWGQAMASGDDLLVRLTSTTTYHFGRVESICGEVRSEEATPMSLDEALEVGRRLCVKCGRLVTLWASYAVDVAGRKSLVHPDR